MKKIIKLKQNNIKTFKLEKKWRFWRSFKQSFLNIKKITFYKKLEWNYNTKRLIWHQILSLYLPKKKNLLVNFNTNKINHIKFYFFIKKLELRLSTILLRARFVFKIINSYNAIKMNLILVNGIIINKNNYILRIQDLFQKRRTNICKTYFKITKRRIYRLQWRKFRWKKARFLLWKIRRTSHFNLYWTRKQNTFLNFLEINYKIPAGIIIKQPFLKELLIKKQTKLFNSTLLKKIYFLY